MYRDTVTLFNRGEDVWYAHVLENVDLNADRAVLIGRYGENCEDRAVLHVKLDGRGRVGGLPYLEPKAWESAQTPSGAVTFRSGNDFDFFVVGAWDGGSVIDDTAYTEGFYNYLNATADGVYAISSVARYSVIPHFEITGR